MMSDTKDADVQQKEAGGDAMGRPRPDGQAAGPANGAHPDIGSGSARPRRPKLVIDYPGFGVGLGAPEITVAQMKRQAVEAADLQFIVRDEAEQFSVVRDLLKKPHAQFLNRRGERRPEIGPVMVAFDKETMTDPDLITALDRVNAHLPPVEVRPVWDGWSELSGKTWTDLAAIERRNPAIRRMLLKEHAEMWKTPWMLSSFAHREVAERVFVVSHDVARNWAARGVAAIFAHPAFDRTPPEDRWRLAREVKPKQLIWVGDEVSDVQALDDFAEIVVVSIDLR